MAEQPKTDRRVRFTLNGVVHDLTRTQVEERLKDVQPESVRKHAVSVGGRWFPVSQAFELALGVPRSTFISHTARRHLAGLGFDVSGDIQIRNPWPAQRQRPSGAPGEDESVPTPGPLPSTGGSWVTQGNVQAAVVASLRSRRWQILSSSADDPRQHGIDIVAGRDEQTVGVEVKGYPGEEDAGPDKRRPSTQATQWYADAVLVAMRLRHREPGFNTVIALPDVPRYRDLHVQSRACLVAAGIRVWWVSADGAVQS